MVRQIATDHCDVVGGGQVHLVTVEGGDSCDLSVRQICLDLYISCQREREREREIEIERE